MALNISQIGQIAPPVLDANGPEAVDEQLPLEKTGQLHGIKCGGCVDFRCADIAPAVSELGKRGLTLDGNLHLIVKMHDDDLWMAFFKDPDGQIFSLMQEAPKGYSLQATTH